MKYRYQTENTCPKEIVFDINDNIITNIKFLGGGCPGNLQALPRLIDGMTVSEITEKIEGIICGRRGTSCADQLSKAVNKAYKSYKKSKNPV